jgi:hypothetical protein
LSSCGARDLGQETGRELNETGRENDFLRTTSMMIKVEEI